VPALDVSILKTMYELYVGRWLNALRLGAPNTTVIPVMTKGEDLLMSAERRDRSSAVLEAACAPQVEWFKSRLEQFQDSVPEHMPKLKIRIDLFSCVSSSVGGEASVEVRAIADHSHDGRRWMMPSRLPDTAPEGSRDLWNHLSARPGYEVRSPHVGLLTLCQAGGVAAPAVAVGPTYAVCLLPPGRQGSALVEFSVNGQDFYSPRELLFFDGSNLTNATEAYLPPVLTILLLSASDATEQLRQVISAALGLSFSAGDQLTDALGAPTTMADDEVRELLISQGVLECSSRTTRVLTTRTTRDELFLEALVPFPTHVPNMTLELMPTWDHPEDDGFVLLASTAIGPYRPWLRAVLSANRTTSLRAIFNGSYFYFRYYEQVLASNDL